MTGGKRVVPILRAGAMLCAALGALVACSSTNAYSNKPLVPAEPAVDPAGPNDGRPGPALREEARCFPQARRANAEVWGREVLALTLSGGGSRAAVLGAAVMLELHDIGALDAVDFVSSVSGGSLAAALYTLGRDPDEAVAGRRGGNERTRQRELEMTSRDLLSPWIARWFRPDSIAKYWFTAYDRTDLFADMLDRQVFAGLGKDGGYPTFADLNPRRAMLILNATNYTDERPSDIFTFTPWDFDEVLGSDVCRYSVARAVAASAAFPGVLHYSTLRNFRRSAGVVGPAAPASYVHLMDGGATDNLGLKGLDQAMERLKLCDEGSRGEGSPRDCRKRLVLVVDAQNGFRGRDPSRPDPRRALDRLVDANFLDAYDTLMHAGYGQLLQSFRRDVEEHGSGKAGGAGVLHLPLMALVRDDWLGYDGQYGNAVRCPERLAESSAGAARGSEEFAIERACVLEATARGLLADGDRRGLRDKLRRIDTDWRIEPDEVACLQIAAYALVAGARPELQQFFGDDRRLNPQDARRFNRDKRVCLRRTAPLA